MKRLHEWMLEQWDEQENEEGICYCYETNIPLSRAQYRGNSAIYHHLLEKGRDKYKQYSMEPWNLIIVHPSTHSQVHTNIDKCPRIKELTLKLKEKYG